MSSGDHRDGGELRVFYSGDQTQGDRHQTIGRSIGDPFLQRTGAKMAGDDAGDELSGCRSSGTIGIIDPEARRVKA